MKFTNQLQATAVAAAVAIGASFAPAPVKAAEFVAADPDWTGGLVTCRLIEFIIEDWGHTVKRVTIPSGPAVMEAIRAGDMNWGCESWPSYSTTKEKYITKYGGDGSIEYLGAVGVVGQSGYYVPRYMIEGDSARNIKATTPDLKTWEDLNKHKAVFATLETGDKGRLIACPVAAWQCKDAERIAGLKLDYHPVELGSETAHWTEMKTAYKRGEPFLAYAWEPHWIHAALDLVEVKLPDHSEAAWPVSDWPQDITYNYGSPKLLKEYPRVAKLITNMNLSNEEQAKIILDIDVNKKKADDVVRAWMKDNEAIWKKWVPTGS